MSTEERVLVVEDEEHLARGLAFNLEAEGYRVELAGRGEAALARLGDSAAPPVDLVLLDVMLPGISGFEVVSRLRSAENPVPVLLLTARDAAADIVRGLDLGADDYLTKPFSLPVLLARVRTLLRRIARPEEGNDTPADFVIGSATVHPARFELEREGRTISITAKEQALLLLLWARRGSAISRGEILQEVWDLNPETRTRVVDTFVLRLRKLIEPDPAVPRYLLSVRSFGYKLVPEPAPGMSRAAELELVIFDCDGVLVDSEPISNRVLADELSKIGLATTVESSMRDYMGRSWPACVEIFERRLGHPLPREFTADFFERLEAALRAELRPVPGIHEALARISTPSCVASSGRHDKMRVTLGLTGLLQRFEGRIFSAADVPRAKPWPDLFLHAAATLRAAPQRCVVVEDSPRGVEAGVAAGMRVLGFAGRTDAGLLDAAGAEVFFDMLELPERLGDPFARV